MRYKIIKRKVFNKLLANKLYKIDFCDNEYIGVILGNIIFFVLAIILFIPFCVISLFQLKGKINEIQKQLDNEMVVKRLKINKTIVEVQND